MVGKMKSAQSDPHYSAPRKKAGGNGPIDDG